MTRPRKRGNGSIYKQPGCSTYTLGYYTFNGKRVRESAGTSDYRQAQVKLRARLAAIDKGEVPEMRRKPIPLAELWAGLKRHYQVNGRRSLGCVERRWKKHLEPFFGNCSANMVTHELLNQYVDHRLSEQAAVASVNRELAALKTMLRLGTRAHRLILPMFPHLAENNVRRGFLEESDFERLQSSAREPWLRLFLEIAFAYGWRKDEILKLRVRQVNVETAVIRLDVGSTKNREGREVAMTSTIRELVRLAVVGKQPDDYLLTRRNGKRVREFRKAWRNLCLRVGLARMLCVSCEQPVMGRRCTTCGNRKPKYTGPILHDFRRSAARELRRAGVAESVVMQIGGWKTREMFRRYAITDSRDIAAAIEKREQARAEFGHDFGHDLTKTAPETVQPAAQPITKRVQ
jgi:integrase